MIVTLLLNSYLTLKNVKLELLVKIKSRESNDLPCHKLPNHVHYLVHAGRHDGITKVIYRRPLGAKEGSLDKAIPADAKVMVIAALGPLNARGEANAHSITDKSTKSESINFGSTVSLNLNIL